MISDEIDALPPLRDVVSRFGLAARKNLGQHFLLDLNLTRKIARAAGDLSNGTVVEIGPGPGGLTRALLTSGAEKLAAVEKDARCIEALQPLQDAAGGRLAVIAEDALRTDITTLGPPPYKIVANLPYNVGTPLLVGWLESSADIDGLTLMFQKEVADRICAAPNSAQYGRLSVLCNWRCETEYLFTIPARAFTPPPKIDSAVVRLTPYRQVPFEGDIKTLQAVTAAAFGQRRKTLRRSLKQLGRDIDSLLENARIDGTLRAENLSVEDFGRLAAALSTA